MTIMAVFLTMVVITVFLVCFYGERKAQDSVRFCLEDLNRTVLNRMDYNLKYNAITVAEGYDEWIRSAPNQYNPEILSRELSSQTDYNINTEMDIVDGKGIITSSSDERNIGFDMASGEQSSDLLRLLDGQEEAYLQEMMPRSMDGSPMKYCGAPMPSYGGFLLIGFAPEDYAVFKEISLTAQVKNVKAGRTGCFLYLNDRFEIISSPDPSVMNQRFVLAEDVKELAENHRVVKRDVYGVKAYIGVLPDGQEYIVAIYPAAEAWEPWIMALLFLLVIYTLIFGLLFFLIRHLIKTHVTEGIYSLNASLSRITGGDLETGADFRETIELDSLSDGINYTVDRLKELIREAEGRIDEELALAAQIQRPFLPKEFPPFPDREEFELYAAMVPAREVGGDFYDYFFTDGDHLALIMADVSGKRLPGAMFMVMAKDTLRHSIQTHGTDVAEAIREVNLELLKENEAGMFATVWLGVLTVSTGHLDYVDAGQEYPAVKRAETEFLAHEDVRSHPVAVREQAEFRAGFLDLKAGDVLYLYTDGVIRAENPEGELFGRSRLLAVLDRKASAPVQEIDEAVRREIADFVQDAPQSDDTASLVLRYKGKRD